MRNQGYKYRLYPKKEQVEMFRKAFDASRLIYNLALETKIYAYKAHGVTLSAIDLINQLPELKAHNPWLRDVDSQSLQNAINRMDSAYQNFFKHGKAFPRYKKKTNEQCFQCPNNKRKIDFDKGLLTIPKIQNIPIKIDRRFEGKIGTVTISKTASEKYYAAIGVELDIINPKLQPVVKNTAVGIDMGVKTFAVLSDGTKFQSESDEYDMNRMKSLQRKLSRKQKGSNNWHKQRVRIACKHEHIANKRKDSMHKVSDVITKRYDTICMESLNIKGMSSRCKPKKDEKGNYKKNGQARKSGLNRKIVNSGFSTFQQMVKYKCEWRGKNFVTVDTFYPSSKKCSCCGYINKDLKLSDRVWTCPECNTEHERDENAATNVREEGLSKIILEKQQSGRGTSKEPAEQRHSRTNGNSISSKSRAKKQEVVI